MNKTTPETAELHSTNPTLTQKWKAHRKAFAIALIMFELFLIIVLSVLAKENSPIDANLGSRNGGYKNDDGHATSFYSVYQHIHVMIFVGFGFLYQFLHGYGFSALGYTLLFGSLCLQWSVFVLWFMENAIGHPEVEGMPHKTWADPIELTTRISLDSDVAAASFLIVFGCIIGRTSPMQLLPITILIIPFFFFNIYLSFTYMKTVDVGGGMMLHMFSAYFGLALCWVLQRPGKETHHRKGGKYRSNVVAMVGTLFLWVYWPSFNAALAANFQERVIGNSILGLAGGAVAAFVIDPLLRDEAKFNMEATLNATIAAGVGLASVGNMAIPPGVAILIGFLSGAVSAVGFAFLTPFLARKFGIEDICGVHNLHGMPGMLSGIAGVFITLAVPEDKYTQEGGWAGFYTIDEGERTRGAQAGMQFVSLLITLAVAIAGGLMTGFICKMPIFLPPTEGNADFGKFGYSITDEKFWYSDDYFWEEAEETSGPAKKEGGDESDYSLTEA